MEQQKRRERIKDYEKQEKRLKELKAAGQSKKKAESKQKEALTRKQEKNKTKLTKNNDEDTGPQELLERPKEYQVTQLKNRNVPIFNIKTFLQVHFRFPETSSLTPPILGLYNIDFHYEDQPHLFKSVSSRPCLVLSFF